MEREASQAGALQAQVASVGFLRRWGERVGGGKRPEAARSPLRPFFLSRRKDE